MTIVDQFTPFTESLFVTASALYIDTYMYRYRTRQIHGKSTQCELGADCRVVRNSIDVDVANVFASATVETGNVACIPFAMKKKENGARGCGLAIHRATAHRLARIMHHSSTASRGRRRRFYCGGANPAAVVAQRTAR